MNAERSHCGWTSSFVSDEVPWDGKNDHGEAVLAQRRREAYLSCRSAVMSGDRLNEEQMKSFTGCNAKEINEGPPETSFQ